MKMLERLPDEKMVYIFNIPQNIEALSMGEKKNRMQKYQKMRLKH